MDDKTLGKNIAFYRGKMSQARLAEMMKTLGWKWSQTTVYNIERGERPLKVTELYDVARLLNVNPSLLLQEDMYSEYQLAILGMKSDLERQRRVAIRELTQWIEVKRSLWDPDGASPAEIENLGEIYWSYRKSFYRENIASRILIDALKEYSLKKYERDYPDHVNVEKFSNESKGDWPGFATLFQSVYGIDLATVENVDENNAENQ